MQLGMVGLGRMGANMVERLMRGGHSCVVYDRAPASVQQAAAKGAIGAVSLEDLVKKLAPPRAAWVMVPAGAPTESTVADLARLMQSGDVVLDGGNSYFKDDVRRARTLWEKKIYYVDVGTSGGVWGLERGYCLMIGGDEKIVQHLDPIFKTLAPGRGSIDRTPGGDGRRGEGEKGRRGDKETGRQGDRSTAEEGYVHCGPAGAGHFVKMVHNGIEYGIMQAYAEGFDVLHGAAGKDLPQEQRFDFNLADIAEVWRRGSVIGSWLLDLTAMALAQDPHLEGFTGSVQDSGEGRWTVHTAVEEAVPVNVLSAALYARFRSRQEHTFADRMLSAMRKMFGGHVER